MSTVLSQRIIVCGLFAFAAVPGFAVPAKAQQAAPAAASSITGTLRTPSGAVVPGATVTASGPARVTATSDASGSFTLAVPPGEYRVVVTKAGYATASTSDVVVAAGTSVPLTVTISEQNLTSLRTIGSVSSRGGGGATINTGAATQSYVGGETFTQVANPQINNVLQRIPDVVVQKLGTQQDTSIVVGGLQPYETQVLIDGHPIALGQYGVWLSQYFTSYLIGGAETQSGPGNTTPFANIAVGGTVNLQTIGFTKATTAEFTTGIDTFGSQYSTLIGTGSYRNASYVVGLGTSGSNGYYFGKKECDMYQSDGFNQNTSTSAGIVAFCDDFSGSLVNRGQLYKLRYDFSPSTSFDANFLGSYGGYSPQGSGWGQSYGPSLVEKCIPGTLVCTNPADANLIGKTINAFYWFPGTNITNVQQLWSGQLRSSLGSTTLLVRPYIGTIQPETYNGTGEGGYPAFFGPDPTAPNYPGPQTLPPGVQIPSTGIPNPNAFESTTCPVGTVNSFQQINSPQNTISSVKGQELCYQYPYSTSEIDKLYGTTFSLVRPIGAGFVDFTYDFHGQSTFAYANAPTNVQVPLSSARYSTFSLTGQVKPIEPLAINFGLYTTQWTLAGQQPVFNAAGVAETNADGSPVYTGLQRSVSRFDPHVAFTYRPKSEWAVRGAVGTSESFPFIGDVSGTAAYQPPAFSQYTAGIITEKNPNLQPEQSIAYSLGVDHRFANRSVISLDVQDSIVHDVFQQLTTQETVAAGVLGIFSPINVARLEAKLATLKYVYAPRIGFGFNLAATADSSILSGIPASAYNTTPALPANNVQVCGGASFTPGLATCDPYLKGYGQFNYTWGDGTFIGLGADYEGKNNAYYQPPFAVADLVYRKPMNKNLDFNLSVENLFNTNSYNYLPAPNLGVPAVANYVPAGTNTVQQGSYSTYLIPAVTRTMRVSLRYHMGR